MNILSKLFTMNKKVEKVKETKLEKKQRKHSVGLMRGAGGVVAETIREGAQERRLKLIKQMEYVRNS